MRDADGLNLRGLARAITGRGGQGQRRAGHSPTTWPVHASPSRTRGRSAATPPRRSSTSPNSAILSVNEVTRRPTAVGDAVAVHYMTILGFSYDHRAFDGVTASRFLARVRDTLQDRDWAAELG